MIVPAFDAAKYIRQALNSVLTQTYQAIEVIVVDDGSSDATSAIVEEFVAKDARFQLVRQGNAGVGAARNTAIRKAHGKYIAPLDADDFWFPEKLEKQVACMEQCGNETGLVYCWSTLIDEQGDFLGLGYPQSVEGHLRRALILRNILQNGSVPLIRAAALEKVGLYLTRAEQGGKQGCEDWDLAVRIAEAFKVHVVPEHLVAYRQASFSMSFNAEGMAASFDVVMRRARRRNRDVACCVFRWSAGHFYFWLAQRQHRCAHWGCCLRYLLKAVCANPVLLLSTGSYRMFIMSLFNASTGSRKNHFAEPKRKRRRPFILNRLFERIELTRWSAALDDGG